MVRRAVSEGDARRRTERWIDEVVIWKNLCPFAREPRASGRIDVTTTMKSDLVEVIEDVCARAMAISRLSEDERGWTEVVVAPACAELETFDAMLDACEIVDGTMDAMGLNGVVQAVAFNPEFRFDGESDEAAAFTNRSPYPSIHLLRECDVERAVDNDKAYVESIPETNSKTLRAIGLDALKRMLETLRAAP